MFFVVIFRVCVLYEDFFVVLRDGNAKPDKRENRVRKPVHPAKLSAPGLLVRPEIHPDIQELIRAEPRYKSDPEAGGPQVFAAHIVRPVKSGDAPPSEGPLCDDRTAGFMQDSYELAMHVCLVPGRRLKTEDRKQKPAAR